MISGIQKKSDSDLVRQIWVKNEYLPMRAISPTGSAIFTTVAELPILINI